MLINTPPVRQPQGRGGTSLKALNNRKMDLRGTYTVTCDSKVDSDVTCAARLALPGARTPADARDQATRSGWSSTATAGRTSDHCPDHTAPNHQENTP